MYLLQIERDDDNLPDFDDVTRKYQKLEKLIHDKVVVSASAIGRGGYLASAVKSALGNGLGVKFFSESKKRLTQKRYGEILVEAADIADPDFKLMGEIREEPFIEACGEQVPLDEICAAYTAPLEAVFPTKTDDAGEVKTPLYEKKNVMQSKYRTAVPRVVVPVFPGTNCEYDTAAAFGRAGAKVRTVIIRNRHAEDVAASVREFAAEIRNAQIIMIPGGFSAGDEPDGSGKFITAVFRNNSVMDATMELLKNRDGLMLGICNGFQALIKLGLVPFGEIRDMDVHSPTLTYNTIGRHVSCAVRTRVTSTDSPWLMLSQPGDVHSVVVSHGEGRFVAEDAVFGRLLKDGRIATQYVDEGGNPTMDVAYNPNGSMHAVEGLLSPDGHVLGKMGHCERAGFGLFRNVDGDYDQKIFEGGVAYFR